MTGLPGDVLHGYTLYDLHRMAAAACRADRSLASDTHTRYDVAWSAIATALAAADPAKPPTRAELVRVGWQAIYTEVREMRRVFGFKSQDGTTGVATAPRFVQYWTVRPEGHEEGLVERIALGQVLDTLSEPYREAVTALATHDNYQKAADALGISYAAFVRRINIARRSIYALWFFPETAPRLRHTDRRVGAYGRQPSTHCSAGHEWTVENTRWHKGRGGGRAKVRRCRACERLRSARSAARRRAAAVVAA